MPAPPASGIADADTAEAATGVAAQLMRAIAAEITERIVPELRSADAIERANFARLVLTALAADLDVLPGVAMRQAAELRARLASALGASPSDPAVAGFQSELARIRAATGSAVGNELAALRDLASRVLRYLVDQPGGAGAEATRPLAGIGQCDADWIAAYDAACAAAAAAPSAAAARAGEPATPDPVSVENFNAYLRRRFPGNLEATTLEIIPIPGGRSKKTFIVGIAGIDSLPREIVMRQDFALKYAGTRVADEYRPLVALSGLGLPVPRPLHLESEISELGPPFMLVDRLRGRPPGTYFGIVTACRGAFLELAGMLARLHRIDPESLGMTRPAGGTDCMRELIRQYQAKWRENATRASPVVDYAYAWALRECERDAGSTVAVHGDAGPYNLLVDDDRLTALLDWEFAHAGDPAEDLGIARVYAESFMPWDDFMQAYLDAGGPPVAESRVRLGMLIQFLKGTTLVAASGRNFREGGTRDFIKGANSFTGLRLIERRIADMLARFGAF